MSRSFAICTLAVLLSACGASPAAVDETSAGSEDTSTDASGSDSAGTETGEGSNDTGETGLGDEGGSPLEDMMGALDCDDLESTLPLIIIDTGGQEILDEPKIDGEIRVVDNGEGQLNCASDQPAFEGPIGIETRGSTSQMYPKKSFGVETRDQLGADLDVSILGMPAESDWVLYAPYPDKTMVRNALTFYLHTQMGHYSSRARHVEVVLNGEYWGVYMWMEKIKRGPGRVAISDLDPDDVAGDAVTGGYIVKVDKLTGDVGTSWVSPYSNEVTLQVHYPKGDSIAPAQAEYIEAAVTGLEDTLAGPNFADAQLGYPARIDVLSFIDFLILQELGRTVDGYRSSSFLHKDRDSLGGRFVAGPMWDFNLSYGNADYCAAFLTTGYQYDFDSVCGDFFEVEIPFWWERLLEDPSFRDALRCRWESLREGLLSDEAMTAFVEARVEELAEAQARNFERWPILGEYVPWNAFVGETYEEEIDYLLMWISERSVWLDANFGGAC